MRTVKKVTNIKDIDYVLNLEYGNITMDILFEMFGEFDGKRRFNPYDEIEIPVGTYGPEDNKNTEKFTCTVGEWVFNRFFVEKNIFNVTHWVEGPITKKKYRNLNTKLSYALLEDDITIDQLKQYIMSIEYFMQLSTVISPSITLKMLLSTKAINKKKEELVKKYDKEIKAGDALIASKIEEELLDFAAEYLDGDESMDSYNSGARGSFDNNFKNMFVMKGAIKDPDPNKGYDIVTSNYVDGISREEYAIMAKSLAAGPYARSKKTEFGGYKEKLYLQAFQHIVLDEPDSDCGTDKYITVSLDKSNIDRYMYSYIIEGDKLVELTSKNMDKYTGKTVKMRFSSMCKGGEKKCNKCAGNLFYRLGITNVGMGLVNIPSVLKNIAMKAFHDGTVRYTEMNPLKAFGFKK